MQNKQKSVQNTGKQQAISMMNDVKEIVLAPSPGCVGLDEGVGSLRKFKLGFSCPGSTFSYSIIISLPYVNKFVTTYVIWPAFSEI